MFLSLEIFNTLTHLFIHIIESLKDKKIKIIDTARVIMHIQTIIN